MAKVEMTKGAARDFAKLPIVVQARLVAALEKLRNWPQVSGVKSLSGNLRGWCRLRVGDYRMRFFVDGDYVVVDKISHRKDIYEN